MNLRTLDVLMHGLTSVSIDTAPLLVATRLWLSSLRCHPCAAQRSTPTATLGRSDTSDICLLDFNCLPFFLCFQ